MAKVVLIEKLLLKNLRKVVAEYAKRFSEGDSVAIKVHMGEYGNLNYIRPPVVGLVAEELKKVGAKPFVFDSPTSYEGSRHTVEGYRETARRNGFTEETIGCPIVISDEGEPLDTEHFKAIPACKKLLEADGMVVLSHFKGHELASFGGSIKNLGMGAFTKEGKTRLHKETKPVIGKDCTGCGACAKVCPFEAISIRDGKVHIDFGECGGCGACVDECHGVLTFSTTRLGNALSEVVAEFLKRFNKEKIFYINLLLDISETCDCLPIGDTDVGPRICPDIGILVSDDILSIDTASLDLARKVSKFGEHCHAKMTAQLDTAKEVGMGEDRYEIETI